tara:strand:- start:1626 stop:2159 length:534 start_codon:yes stop_codon:yes gene_type:complete
VLEEHLARARLKSEHARNVSWIYSVVSGANIAGVTLKSVEVMDPVRMTSAVVTPIVHVYERGTWRAAAIKFRTPAGYNGGITIALAIEEGGSIIGLKVLSHLETAGFADVITQSDPSWIKPLVNLSLESHDASRWRLRIHGGDVDGVSGATVTASAVVAAVYTALNVLNQTMATPKE